MKMLCRTLVLLTLVLLCLPPANADVITIPNPSRFFYHDTSLINATREICLLFQGGGFWEKAEIETVGCYIMDTEQKGDLLILSVYTEHAVFDLSSGVPENIAGGSTPVLITVRQSDENDYELLSYDTPSDGEGYKEGIVRLFPKDVAQALIVEGQQDEFQELASSDAYSMAESYMAYKNGADKAGVWNEFLQTGSNTKAMELVRKAIDSKYPYFDGSWIWSPKQRCYTLSIEGEKSYSGILSFSTSDLNGNLLSSFKIQVQDQDLVVLEGEIPTIVFE